MKKAVAARRALFIKKSIEIPMTDCVYFDGYHDRDGYGQFQFRFEGNKKNIQAHRAAYIIHNNEDLTKEDVVMHVCDNPSCINPSHLIKGTHNDNVQDRVIKNRSATSIKGTWKGGRTRLDSAEKGKGEQI